MNSEKLKKIKVPKLQNTYIFDESLSKFGTIKDRRNEKVLGEAARLHVDKLVLITSGNNGYSLARLAKDTNIKIVCIVNRNLDNQIKEILKRVSYQVIELNLEQKILRPEEIISIARENDQEVIWDVTNGYEESYISIVDEICQKIIPDYIICPVGSGGIYIGIIEGVEKYCPKTKVIGIGTQSTFQSFADKLSTPWTPYQRAVENKTLQGHYIFRLNEEEIKKTYLQYKNIASVEPSSAIVFAAQSHFKFKPTDKIIFINSGKMKWN
ncbi:MAG TPA: pyridoxal-phosphate dependent enzyme [Candidatus Paceibacterota bacterium]